MAVTPSPLHANDRRLLDPDPRFAELVEAKSRVVEEVCKSWFNGQFSKIPQGYTYLGQFLAHDIAAREGGASRNWKIDLDSVYGEGAVVDTTGRFHYREATDELVADLLREAGSNRARIPEFRNDDHLIIAQLHLLMQRFHNRVIELLESDPNYSAESPSVRMRQAREFVVALFQKIIFEDYLPRVTFPAVYDHYLKGNASFTAIEDSASGLPYEMTHAALRFGHSMVREVYALNRNSTGAKNVDINNLFRFTGEHGRKSFAGVPKSLLIDWSVFFPIHARNTPDSSLRINPFITPKLAGAGVIRIDMVKLNIAAGIRKQLCSAQSVVSAFVNAGAWALGVRSDLPIFSANRRPVEMLKANGLWDAMPLWLFILIEADGLSAGNSLGPLGSILLCEAVVHALRTSGKITYPDALRRFADVPGLAAIDSLKALIAVAHA